MAVLFAAGPLRCNCSEAGHAMAGFGAVHGANSMAKSPHSDCTVVAGGPGFEVGFYTSIPAGASFSVSSGITIRLEFLNQSS